MILLKRISLLVILSIAVSVGTIGVWAVRGAYACSITSSHCYADSEEDGISNNLGIAGFLYIQCLYYPDRTAEANTEMWDTNGKYWVEAGVKSGVDYYDHYHDRDWFWADSRPSGYSEHYNGNWAQAGTGTNYGDLIEYIGNDDWDIYGGNTDFLLGESTSQPLMDGRWMNAGTEYTASTTSSGIRDIGNVNGQEYKDSGGTWHFIDGGGYDNSSVNNWFSHSYDPNSSTMSWTGPC